MNKFTEGPWPRSSQFSVVIGDTRVSTQLTGYKFSTIAEREANADLISAAPDMYEALEQAVTSMLDSGYSLDSAAVRACDIALAKARGEL